MSSWARYNPLVIGPVLNAVARPVRGALRAVRACPGTFAGVALAILVLNIMLPPLLLSAVRGPWTYFTFNPWLKRLPEYLVSPAPLSEKLDFVSRAAVLWFSADGPYGAPEWGFAVDTMDLLRFHVMAILFGTYFALWVYRRSTAARPGSPVRVARGGGIAGALTSVLELSTGPCSVVGCGAPVLPVIGLAFAGLSSSTLALLSGLSRVAAVVLFVVLAVGVSYLGWVVGSSHRVSAPPTAFRPGHPEGHRTTS
jgi:hypothetical protein